MAGNTSDSGESPIQGPGGRGNAMDGTGSPFDHQMHPYDGSKPVDWQSRTGNAVDDASKPIMPDGYWGAGIGNGSNGRSVTITWDSPGNGNAPGGPSSPILHLSTHDALISFQFAIELGGMVKGFFQEVDGIGSEHELIEHKLVSTSGHAYTIMQPGRIKWNQLTFKRGITDSLDIWDWRTLVEHGKVKKMRKNCSLLMFRRDYSVVARWDIVRAWPLKVSGPSLKADSNDYGVEEFVLAHEGMKRVRA